MKNKDVPEVVVIIPTYNEAENIEKTVKVVFNSFPKNDWKYHILVIDGNSPDKTADIVRKLIPNYKNLHLIVEKEKGGLGAAYLRGMDYAFDSIGASYVFEFDADLQHDPNKIREFIQKLEEGFDVVTGTRYSRGGSIPKEWGFHRKFLSKGGNFFTRIMFMPSNITDWTSGYTALSKEVYRRIKKNLSLEKGYTFQISLKKNAKDRDFKIAEIPYDFKDRTYGSSKLGSEFLFRALYFVLKTRFIDFFTSSFFKVCLVGGFGALVQIFSFFVLEEFLIFFIAHNLSIFLAILSNYILNNIFSFKEYKITGFTNILKKFPAFILVSMGSILIQNIVMFVSIYLFGDKGFREDIYNIVGILLGLISNFYFYKKIIWKTKK